MPRTAVSDLPLRNLRDEANISLEDMAEILTRRTGRPISTAYVRTLEHRGTEIYTYISAYSEATGKHISLVASAAALRKNKVSI